jgi:hypothetical protein
VAVHPHIGPDYHRIDRAAAFQVRDASNDAGVIALVPKIDVRHEVGT